MKKIVFISTLLLSLNIFGQMGTRTVCGESDDRVPSFDMKIGRVVNSLIGKTYVCTATLIGKRCLVTAGHCEEAMEYVEFNVPLSTDGKLKHPSDEFIYEIDSNFKKVNGYGIGNDWAVFRVLPGDNGYYPGDLYGNYEVNYKRPKVNKPVSITGYGVIKESELSATQQTHTGPLHYMSRGAIYHKVDTTGGNSGATIIQDEKVVGIHTHGGCRASEESNNYGTALYYSKNFIKQIKACLADD